MGDPGGGEGDLTPLLPPHSQLALTPCTPEAGPQIPPTAGAHNNGCNAVQFIAEDRIATAGADAAVRLWAFTP